MIRSYIVIVSALLADFAETDLSLYIYISICISSTFLLILLCRLWSVYIKCQHIFSMVVIVIHTNTYIQLDEESEGDDGSFHA